MRTFFVILLAVCLLLITFSGCNITNEPDVWNGHIAEAFESGTGSEKNPYIIETASQLAFLAQEVNSGIDYKGKYIVLDRDLDLNNREWMPIGNGTYSFHGIFDGNGHTISNFKIINGISFPSESSNEAIDQYTTGLFGSCCNAAIKNIAIEKASITIQNITNVSTIMGGILIGTMHSDSTAEISNVSVVDSTISVFELDNNSSSLRIGGIIGYLSGNDDSSLLMKNIHANTCISIENGSASYNLVGGLAGASSTYNLFEVSNCASYLSVNVDTENAYLQHNFIGAFGSMVTKNDIVSISNVFSKVTTNKINDISHGYYAYNANAIIGETNHAKQKDGTRIGGYKFQNLFGYVEQVDAPTGEIAKSVQLYELSSQVIYAETNCRGCESLPTDHGFDESVWNLTDLSTPKIIMK